MGATDQELVLPTMARFSLGRVKGTPAALDAMMLRDVPPSSLLSRHVTGDWGDVDAEDARANEQALKDEARLLSAYKLNDDVTIWLITEADRSYTTFLLPEEY